MKKIKILFTNKDFKIYFSQTQRAIRKSKRLKMKIQITENPFKKEIYIRVQLT